LSTLVIIFAANFGVLLDKSSSNFVQNAQAFEAAEAGLEFGINYLQQNSATILANPVNGYIPAYSNSNTSNVALGNGSKYTITYSNPVAYNYKLIQIASTGTSSDGTSTRVVSQQVYFGSLLENPPNSLLVSKGNVSLSGSSELTNTQTNNAVQAGGSVTITGSAQINTSSGSGIQSNVSSLSSMSQNDFFASYFGVSMNTVKNNVAHYYSNSSSTDYSRTLNGLNGTSIWIDQTGGTASINGSITLGSASNPVLLIVNGNLSLSGSITIYGLVFVMGTATTTVTGSVQLTGGMISATNMSMTGSTSFTYNSTTFTNLQNQSSMSYYAKVPGSWKDF